MKATEKKKEYMKQYNKTHKEKIKIAQKKYYENHKEYFKQFNRSNYKELQQRIEKAVEYINDDENLWVALGEDCGRPDDLEELLEILNGRSDE